MEHDAVAKILTIEAIMYDLDMSFQNFGETIKALLDHEEYLHKNNLKFEKENEGFGSK